MGLLNSPVIIVGLGSQAKSWALNLRDSGIKVNILLREKSPSFQLAKQLNFKTLTFEKDDLSSFNIFLLLTPDHTHEDILSKYQGLFKDQTYFVYAHGFSYCKSNLKTLFPQWNHLLLAPKAIASEVRFQYETKGKLAAAYSTEGAKDQEKAQEIISWLSQGIGINVGPFPVSFQEECFADLFSEQSLLCSILPYASSLSFKKLREKGVSKEIAYFECWAELKLICDALVKMGPTGFFNVSDTFVCTRDSILFSPFVLNADNYFWDFGDGIYSYDSIPYHNYIQSGTYNPSLVITNNSGCQLTLGAPSEIEVRHIEVSAGIDHAICLGETVQLNAVGDGAVFNWSPVSTLNNSSISSILKI